MNAAQGQELTRTRRYVCRKDPSGEWLLHTPRLREGAYAGPDTGRALRRAPQCF